MSPSWMSSPVSGSRVYTRNGRRSGMLGLCMVALLPAPGDTRDPGAWWSGEPDRLDACLESLPVRLDLVLHPVAGAPGAELALGDVGRDHSRERGLDLVGAGLD